MHTFFLDTDKCIYKIYDG